MQFLKFYATKAYSTTDLASLESSPLIPSDEEPLTTEPMSKPHELFTLNSVNAPSARTTASVRKNTSAATIKHKTVLIILFISRSAVFYYFTSKV